MEFIKQVYTYLMKPRAAELCQCEIISRWVSFEDTTIFHKFQWVHNNALLNKISHFFQIKEIRFSKISLVRMRLA